MKKDKVFLSIVIPCYNEIENLNRGVLDEVRDFLVTQDYTWEVIISNDGSNDKSLKFVQNFASKNKGFRVLDNPHAGKPFAVKSGIEAAKGKYVLFADMDQSIPLSEVKKFLPFFKKDFDVVVGSRGAERKGFSWYRQIMAWGFRTVRMLILLKDIIDTQCGFKAFKTDVAKEIFPRLQVFQVKEVPEGWKVTAFDVELLFLAQKRRCKMAEVLVEWVDRDVTRGKKHNFVKESYEMASEIARVRLNDLRGLYEK